MSLMGRKRVGINLLKITCTFGIGRRTKKRNKKLLNNSITKTKLTKTKCKASTLQEGEHCTYFHFLIKQRPVHYVSSIYASVYVDIYIILILFKRKKFVSHFKFSLVTTKKMISDDVREAVKAAAAAKQRMSVEKVKVETDLEPLKSEFEKKKKELAELPEGLFEFESAGASFYVGKVPLPRKLKLDTPQVANALKTIWLAPGDAFNTFIKKETALAKRRIAARKKSGKEVSATKLFLDTKLAEGDEHALCARFLAEELKKASETSEVAVVCRKRPIKDVVLRDASALSPRKRRIVTEFLDKKHEYETKKVEESSTLSDLKDEVKTLDKALQENKDFMTFVEEKERHVRLPVCAETGSVVSKDAPKNATELGGGAGATSSMPAQVSEVKHCLAVEEKRAPCGGKDGRTMRMLNAMDIVGIKTFADVGGRVEALASAMCVAESNTHEKPVKTLKHTGDVQFMKRFKKRRLSEKD